MRQVDKVLACVPALLLTASVLLRADEQDRPTIRSGDPVSAAHPGSWTGRCELGAWPGELAADLSVTASTDCVVTFPVRTTSPRAQALMNLGVMQLHACWLKEAERCFREAAILDPRCAAACWGMAMANLDDEPRARKFIDAAVAIKTSVRTVRSHEGMYIDALAAFLDAGSRRDPERRSTYARALDRIVRDDPADASARLFLAHQLAADHSEGREGSSLAAADALLRLTIQSVPGHPSHLERVLLWCDEQPELALDSAARCGLVSPSIPPLWHLPSHLYAGLGRQDDAIWHLQAAARAYHAYQERNGLLPDQAPGYAHNSECLVRSLLEAGRVRQAIEEAEAMIAMPRHPLFDTEQRPACSTRGTRLRFESLSRYELWDDLRATSRLPATTPAAGRPGEWLEVRYLGRARFATGDCHGGRAALAWLSGMMSKLPELERVELARAANSDQPGIRTRFAVAARAVRAACAELEGRDAIAGGEVDRGMRLLVQAGDLDPADLARTQIRAGQNEAAENALMELIARQPGNPLPRALLVELRWRLGRLQDAEQAFAALREKSGQADLDAPPFKRLAPIASALGYPADWRLRTPRPSDTQNRPELDALGPARWQPAQAPDWTLEDGTGKRLSLSSYRGRPVVVIFYLGVGCLHCVQQLEAIAPRTRDFAAAGIALIGVSTDGREKLQKSMKDYGDEAFPFPLLSDQALSVFRRYHLFDLVSSQPLHGTFLIDGSGLVRWWDIGHEPFMDVDFLLDESCRLLARPAARAAAGAGNDSP